MESDIIISPYHKPDNIKDVIYEVRGQKVMLDTDLAEMYEVEVSQLKRQVRRNIDRFPKDFMFELTPEEVSSLRCQNGILKTGRGQHSKYAPFAVECLRRRNITRPKRHQRPAGADQQRSGPTNRSHQRRPRPVERRKGQTP